MAVKLAHPLKVERQRRNMSQRVLADFAGLGLSTVVRAERGEQIGAEARRRICEYLGKTSEELGLIPNDIEIYLDKRSNGTPPEILHEEGIGDDVNRREALKHIGMAGAFAIWGGSEEPWERLSSVIARPSAIDDATISNLEGLTKSYWNLRASIPSHDLLSGVTGHLETITNMLRNTSSGTYRLYTLASETALLAGQMTFDTNNHAAARGYYKVSAEAAIEGKDDTLQAVAFARASFVFIEKTEYSNSLTLLNKANSLAQKSGNNLVRGWIAAIQAEAYANLQDSSSCLRLLNESEEALARSGSISDSYATGFSPSRLSSYRGICHSRLHQPERALGALQEALTLIGPASMRRKPRILTDMATVYAQQGEVDEACQLASQALLLTRQTHNSMVLPRLKRFRQAVERWHSTAPVRAFDEQLLLA